VAELDDLVNTYVLRHCFVCKVLSLAELALCFHFLHFASQNGSTSVLLLRRMEVCFRFDAR